MFCFRNARNRDCPASITARWAVTGIAFLTVSAVQFPAHELWDTAELADKREIEVGDVEIAIHQLVKAESAYFERLWEQLTGRQRALLQALAHRGADELFSQAVREQYRLGPASSVQKSLHALDAQDILDRYRESYFFIDPLLSNWIRDSIR